MGYHPWDPQAGSYLMPTIAEPLGSTATLALATPAGENASTGNTTIINRLEAKECDTQDDCTYECALCPEGKYVRAAEKTPHSK